MMSRRWGARRDVVGRCSPRRASCSVGRAEPRAPREGVYDELCAEGESGCDAQILRLAAVYAAGATTIPLSGMAWGPLLDAKGAKTARLLSLAIFAPSCVLFAFADSRTFDVYVSAAALISVGGMGFFFSHFVIAEHFAADHFALVHSLINCSFDASTVTFTVWNSSTARATSRALFLRHGVPRVRTRRSARRGRGRAPLPARRATTSGRREGRRCARRGRRFDPADAAVADDAPPPPAPQSRVDVDEGGKTFSAQVRTPAFAWLMAWSVIAIYRTMFVLGSISEQMSRGGDGRSLAEARDLVRRVQRSHPRQRRAHPPFGRFVDARGARRVRPRQRPGRLHLRRDLRRAIVGALPAFLAFGCFMAWNYSLA